MELSAEDSLRLNVLLANPLQAVRINESSMVVHALSESGEARVALNPNGKDDQYLKLVRELLSTQILGSPGGYPIFLRRWTRMGQAKDDSLEQLLLLGEPEAVVAVVHASGVSVEIARRAWWAMPTADNARRMLEKPCIVDSELGRELAEYLIEYLPFETEHKEMLETIRLVLQPGLVGDKVRDKLWRLATRKTSFYIGFMDALADDLPEQGSARNDYEDTKKRLQPLLDNNNPIAQQYCRCLTAAGQKFLCTAEVAFIKPANQDVVVELLKSIQRYFSSVCPNSDSGADMQTVLSDATELLDVPGVCPTTHAIQEVLSLIPDRREDISALLALAWVGESLINPIFARTDAIGSVMRKKMESVSGPIRDQLAQLR